MGHLLYLIVEEDKLASGLMISALVIYLNANDTRGGFYKLAQEYGMLAANPSQDQKIRFWGDQLNGLYARYRRPRRERVTNADSPQ